MAKVVFLQNLWFEFMGPMYLSAALKADGHECELLIGDSAEDMIPLLLQTQPDLVAFSVMTGMHQWVIETACRVKEVLHCPIILGGPHPTFFPEIINERGIDLICRGEGEEAIVELAAAIDAASEISGIANLWVKTGGSVVRNELRRLEQDLDSIPFADRELYARYPVLSGNSVKVVISSRGCPYDCTFCFNHQMAELYRGKGHYVRHRSPAAVLDEIGQVKSERVISRIYFADDTFALEKRWLKEFLPNYGQEVGIPFHCLVRVNQLDDELAALLKANGCETVFFGIESGDESIRNVMLQKAVSDSDIRKGAAILKRHGIRFRTYNIVGFPGETLSQALQTIELNIEIATDYPWCSLFMPFPGTRLADYAREKGYLRKDLSVNDLDSSFHVTSTLENPDRNRLINLHKFFQTAVLFPSLLPLIRMLIKLPPNFMFQIWFGLVYSHCYLRSEGRGFRQTLAMAMKNRQFFRKR